jgi:hypothetical protein
LAHTFTSPCFGHEPKARVMTPTIGWRGYEMEHTRNL